ncbi:MAG: hypothetical protein IKN71_05325 [Alphaproteobacteria bacterium]|nr:hypothetical protein [Alphaproteobacteria bacterium]
MNFSEAEKYIATHRRETIQNFCRFLDTDVLLFWSDKPDLFAYQNQHWQPLLNKLNSVFKLDLQKTTTLLPPKNKTAEIIFEKILTEMPDKELTGCFLAASELKSVLLGLLLAKKEISAAEAFEASFLEELYQNKFWGEDVAAANARNTTRKSLSEVEGYLNS